MFSGGKGRRISCRRQSKKWDCRELTANLLPTSNEGGGIQGRITLFSGGKGRRISRRRQSEKRDWRELTANLLSTRNEGGGGERNRKNITGP